MGQKNCQSNNKGRNCPGPKHLRHKEGNRSDKEIGRKKAWHNIDTTSHDFNYNKGFNCFYTNADSLPNKMKELEVLTKNSHPKVIAITEINPKTNRYEIEESDIKLDGYNLFYNHTTTGRGVGIYVHKSIQATTYDLENKIEDSLWLEIQMNNADKLIIGCIYRSPSSNKEQDGLFLKMIDSFKNIQSSHLLILGDFNLPKIEWNHWESSSQNPEDLDNKFLEGLRDAFLYQHINSPTRGRAGNKPSILDLILTNEEGMVSDLEIWSPIGKSDHACLSFWFNCYLINTEKKFTRYMYDKANYEAMRRDLDIDWESELAKRITVDEKWRYIHNKISDTTAKHIPTRNSKIDNNKKIRAPLDKDILAKIKKKHKAWKKYISSKDSDTYKDYCRLRNHIRKLTKLARRNKESDIAKEAKYNPQKFWSFVNNKLYTKPSIPNLYNSSNETTLTEDDEEKANVLSDFFSTVFTDEDTTNIPPFPDRQFNSTLDNIEINRELVLKKLTNLNTSKSPGPDKIHPRILKELASTLSTPLTILFTASLEQKKIPSDWKYAKVSAIYKKGNKKQPGNYRPVSLTSIICKLLESVIRNSIMEHMQINNLFSNTQFGFIEGRSTILQLLKVLDIWTDILNNNESIDAIYLDFMKAFDKVPHQRLLHKLKSYGLGQNIVDWMGSFLLGRKQQVCVNGANSEWKSVTSGIPQGSVLGPLLFVLYINDMPDNITSSIFLFADDTKIFANSSNPQNTAILQEDLGKLLQWSKTWLLKFHPQKCRVLDINTHDRKHNDYYLDDVQLEHSTCEKDLGIFVDNKLKFDTHIGTKVNKANKILGAIRRAFSYLDKNNFLRLYTSLVRPHLEYGNPVWSPQYTKDIITIENVQRRATKMIPDIRDKPYQDRLKYLNLPTLAYRRTRGDMVETYKILNNKYDNRVSDILCLHSSITDNQQRVRGHSKKLYKRKHNNNKRKHYFGYRVVSPWNSLPESVVSAPSTKAFEKRLDRFWATQNLKFDFKKNINIHHSNNTPLRSGSKEENIIDQLTLEL